MCTSASLVECWYLYRHSGKNHRGHRASPSQKHEANPAEFVSLRLIATPGLVVSYLFAARKTLLGSLKTLRKSLFWSRQDLIFGVIIWWFFCIFNHFHISWCFLWFFTLTSAHWTPFSILQLEFFRKEILECCSQPVDLFFTASNSKCLRQVFSFWFVF